MENTLYDSNNTVLDALTKYGDMVRRICFMYLKNQTDLEDIFQEVFLKLLQHNDKFDNEEHKKAWLIRVTVNQCKDFHKSFFRKNVCSIEDMDIPFEDEQESEVIREVLSLPVKYKDVVYLFYYEGYTVPEISNILGVKENTIYSHLHRAKIILKEKLGGSQYGEDF